MAVTTELNINDLRGTFVDYNRESNFSTAGLEIVFNFFASSMCCSYNEYTTQEVIDAYGVEIPKRDDFADDNDYTTAVNEAANIYLQNNTALLGSSIDGETTRYVFMTL